MRGRAHRSIIISATNKNDPGKESDRYICANAHHTTFRPGIMDSLRYPKKRLANHYYQQLFIRY